MIIFNDENVDELVKALFDNETFKDRLNDWISDAIGDRVSDRVDSAMSDVSLHADDIKGLESAINEAINNASVSISA